MIVKIFQIFLLIILIFFVALLIIDFIQDSLMVCPKKGSFIGWKCAYKTNPALFGHGVKFVLIKLEIPEDAKRSSPPGRRKCRCSKAKVLEIVTLDKGKPTEEFIDVAYSIYNPFFVYKVGGWVFVNNFCEDRNIECAPGIHFFMEKEEAMRYML